MTRFRFVPFIVFVFVMALGMVPVQGQDLGRMWTFTPKMGQGPAFEEALRGHMEFREAQGDPWDWQIYQVVVGDNVGDYIAASWDHTWEDFDAYDAYEGAGILSAHFQATAGATLEDMTTVITDDSQGIEKLPEDPNYEVNLVFVTNFYLMPGKQGAFNEALMKFDEAIKEANVPFYYSSSVPAAGGSGPLYTIAGLTSNWAEFADPDPNMEQIMVEKYGEEDAVEIFNAFGEAVHHTESFVVRYRRDLSSGGGM